MALLSLKRDTDANIKTAPFSDGQMAVAYDSNSLYFDVEYDVTGEDVPVQERVAISSDGVKEFIGTTAEWEAVPAAEKLKYTIINITDDSIDGSILYNTTGQNTDGAMTQKAVTDALNANSGGSKITVTTEDSELFGGTVAITDGTSSVTGVLSESGTVTINISMTGTLQISVVNGDYEGGATLSAPYYGNYSVAVEAADIYTLNITTNEASLFGQTITATDGTNVKTGTISAEGTATLRITFTGSVTVTATDGEQTASTTVSVQSGTDEYSLSLSFVKIYGVEWDGTSTTLWSRTDDSAMFTNPTPAIGNGAGSSPFDGLMPWSGMEKVTDSAGGTLVKIPKFYYKWTKSGNVMRLQIADGQASGFSVSPAHMDRGDGKGERDYVYVGRYHCASSFKSQSGVKPLASQTRAQFRTGCHNLGSSYWMMDYATWVTIQMLYLVEFADWNSQNTIGYGCGNNSSTENMGSTDSMTYHTGTTAASRSTYGHTQYRWIEDLWGNVYDWIDGIRFSDADVYAYLNPTGYSDASGGTKVGTRPTSGNYISAYSVAQSNGYEWFIYPSAVSGSRSTYVCDCCYYNASGVVSYAGGFYSQYQDYGLFCLGNSAASVSHQSIGSRLIKLP